jgi:hypothetical protein
MINIGISDIWGAYNPDKKLFMYRSSGTIEESCGARILFSTYSLTIWSTKPPKDSNNANK